jgi:hypothetical protein
MLGIQGRDLVEDFSWKEHCGRRCVRWPGFVDRHEALWRGDEYHGRKNQQNLIEAGGVVMCEVSSSLIYITRNISTDVPNHWAHEKPCKPSCGSRYEQICSCSKYY